MDWTERRERFRALLAGNRCVHTGSVYDAITARIAEELGFEVGIFSGSVGSMAVLGAPDLVVLTLSEFAAQAYRICRAGNLCLLVDADHGYGNALNVRRTVEELETSGVCALSIEDTLLPRPYGTSSKPTLIPIEEGIGKMKAALSARQDKKLVIAGRTSALQLTSLDDAMRRAKAYEAAGVDAIFLAGGVTVEAIEAISSRDQHSADYRRRRRPSGRSRLDGGAQGASRLAGTCPVQRRRAGRLQHAEGAARRYETRRIDRNCPARTDAAGDAGRRLPPMDQGFSGRGITPRALRKQRGISCAFLPSRSLLGPGLLTLTASCVWPQPEAAAPQPSPAAAVAAPGPVSLTSPPSPPAVVAAEPSAPTVASAGPAPPAREIEFVPLPFLWSRMLTSRRRPGV